MVQPYFHAYRRIVHSFGPEILLESGEINREALGNIIFSQPEKRQLLNSITHPEIQKEMLKQILKYFVLGKQLGELILLCRILGAPALLIKMIISLLVMCPFYYTYGKGRKGWKRNFADSLCDILFAITLIQFISSGFSVLYICPLHL